jgi:hypothetical protein
MNIRSHHRLTLSLVLVAACSSAPSELEPKSGGAFDSADLAVEEAARDDSPELDAELSASELEMLQRYYSEHGVTMDEYSVFGRAVVFEGDMLVNADDVLRAARAEARIPGDAESLIEKGKVAGKTDLTGTFPDCAVEVCGAAAPSRYAFTVSSTAISFIRPDTTLKYYIVIANAVPSYFDSVLSKAAARIMNASTSDCLGTNLFQVIRAGAYAQLTASERESTYRISVNTGNFGTVCSGIGAGCANFPRFGTVKVGGTTLNRFRVGDRIQFVHVALSNPTTALVADDEYSVSVATHELLHAMGFAHPEQTSLGQLAVPGTAAGASHLSIMYGSSEDPLRRTTLQTDDLAMLRKLYSGNCTASNTARTIVP